MSSKHPPQIPLSFDVDPSSGRDDLIMAQSIDAAISIVDLWPNWVSPIVILAGPTGSGKSHITSIWQQRSGAHKINADILLDDIVVKVGQGPILFEDVDRLIETGALDETKLFHILNTVKEAQSSLLMTARSWPASWRVELPDLASRIKAATIVEIGEPDELLLTQVMFKLFADRQVDIDAKIVNYLVMRMERSLAVAQQIVERMDHLALSRKVAINRAIALEVLTELETAQAAL